jgi:hypothetical protein
LVSQIHCHIIKDSPSTFGAKKPAVGWWFAYLNSQWRISLTNTITTVISNCIIKEWHSLCCEER